MDALYPKQRSDVRDRVVEGEAILLDREGGLIHQLNRTAAFIWARCDGSSTLGDIAQQLVEAFDVDDATAATDVAAIIAQLRQLTLLEPS